MARVFVVHQGDPVAEVRCWWWLSFSSEAGWLGGCVVPAESFFDAALAVTVRGHNPGGEMAGFELGEGDASKIKPLEPYRFYSKVELEAFGEVAKLVHQEDPDR